MNELIREIHACKKCAIESNTKNKTIGKGSKAPKVLFVGLNPGKEENEVGIPFVGRSGKLLNKWIRFLGLDNSNCAVVNMIKCFTPNQTGLTGEETDNCYPFLERQIDILKPDYIVSLGAPVFEKMTGKKIPITTAAGNWYSTSLVRYTVKLSNIENTNALSTDGTYDVFVMPHPSYYLRQGGHGWEQPLQKLKDILDPQKIDMPMQEFSVTQGYVPLHVHSEHSTGDGAGKLEDNLKDAYTKGFKTLALTDHGTIGGWYYFQKACEELGIKSILGLELYVADDYEVKDRNLKHLVVLAKNQQGIRNIFKLDTIATENAYYKPRITLDDVIKHRAGLITMSACTGGVIAKRLLEGQVDEAYDIARLLKKEFGNDFYIELQVHDFDQQHIVNPSLIDISQKYDIPTVVTCDVHYKDIEAKELHNAVKSIAYHTKYGQSSFDGDTHCFLTDSQLMRAGKKVKISEDIMRESMRNTFKVADKCDGKLETYGTVIPEFEIPESFI